MNLTRSFISLPLKLLLMSFIVIATSCGDGDDDTSIVINQPEAPEREEGPGTTGGTIVINNNYNPNIKIRNKNVVVDNDRREVLVRFVVRDASPVVHQHVVYPANSCTNIINIDQNGDNVVDRQELEQQVGEPVATLTDAQGSNYDYANSIPLNQLSENRERFIFVLYGTQGNANLPVACFNFVINVENPQPDTTACVTPRQRDRIEDFFVRLAEWERLEGELEESQPTNNGTTQFKGTGPVTATQATNGESWEINGVFKEEPEATASVNYSWVGEFKGDGCFYSRGSKSEIISVSSNSLNFVSADEDGNLTKESFWTLLPDSFKKVETIEKDGETVKTTKLNLIKL